MNSDFGQFVEPTTESLRVWVTTRNYEMEGNIYLSRSMKESRRLTNLLNSDRRFLALTKVKIKNRTTNAWEPDEVGYVQVNMDSIELIKPIENE